MVIEKLDTPKIIMLPPTLVLLHVTLGLVLNWAVPMSFGHAWGWLGLALVVFALTVIAWSRRIFQKAGTNIAPNQPTLSIVQEGPYHYSRNPIYLCFLVGFVGLSFLADAPMMMLFIFPLFYILDRHVIVPEETYLSQKFGPVYLDYKAQVRRWI